MKKLRVLHLATHLNPGGISQYIKQIIEPHAAIGIETYVASSGGAWAGEFQDRGAHLFHLPIRTKSELSPRLWFALPTLLKLIEEHSIDVLHAHTRVTQILARRAQRICKIPVIATCHGYYKNRLGRRLSKAWGDLTVAISEPVATDLEETFHLPPSKIRLVSNGVDIQALEKRCAEIDRQAARQTFGFSNEDFVIGVIARLVDDKGHAYLIKAFAELKKKYPHIKLIIVGDGRSRPGLEVLARELKVQDEVVFTGNISDVSNPLLSMDLFAFPATWREGFGLSIAEAMACKIPVLATRIHALGATIEHGSNGYLVEPKDVNALVVGISELIENSALRKKLADTGRELVGERYTVTRMAQEIRGVYDEVLGNA